MAKKKDEERRVRFGSYVTEEDMDYCWQSMAAKGLPAIPQEYANFVKSCNGYSRRGVVFYGTNQGEVLEKGHDLVSNNEDFAKYNKDLRHCVLLGRANMDHFLYNTETERYQIVERGYVSAEEEFDTFAQMLDYANRSYK